MSEGIPDTSLVRSLPRVLCEARASAFLSMLASSRSVSPVCVPAQPTSWALLTCSPRALPSHLCLGLPKYLTL